MFNCFLSWFVSVQVSDAYVNVSSSSMHFNTFHLHALNRSITYKLPTNCDWNTKTLKCIVLVIYVSWIQFNACLQKMDLSKYFAVWLPRLTLTVDAKRKRLYASKPPTNTVALQVTCFKFYAMAWWWSNDRILLPVSWIIIYCVWLRTFIFIIVF